MGGVFPRMHRRASASMRERATELGGTCTVESLLGGGTRVSARLPLGGSGR